MKVLFTVVLSCLLVACGGGSSSTNSSEPTDNDSGGGSGGVVTVPSPVVPSLEASSKTLTVSWSPVSGATSYRVFMNADGHSGFVNVSGDLPSTATSFSITVSVAEFNWDNALFFVQACNSAGCSDSGIENPAELEAAAIGRVTVPGSASNAKFSSTFALSGNGQTLIASVYNASGCASFYAVTRTESGLTLSGPFSTESAAYCSNNGVSSLSVSDDGSVFAFVQGEKVTISSNAANYLYVFKKDGASWTLLSRTSSATYKFVKLSRDASVLALYGTGVKLLTKNENGTYSDAQTLIPTSGLFLKAGSFGVSVSMDYSGNTVAIGAPTTVRTNSVNEIGAPSGAVFLFERGVTWTQKAVLTFQHYALVNNNTLGVNDMGAAVELSADGNVLFTNSKSLSNSNTYTLEGVYQYTKPSTGWANNVTPYAFILAENMEASDNFGAYISSSADGSSVLISSPAESSNAVGVNGDSLNNLSPSSGAAYLFKKENGSWLQKAYIKAGTSTANNYSIGQMSADGSTIVVSAPLETWNTQYEGALYIY